MVSLSAIKKRPAPQQVYPMGWEFLVFANLVADCARGLASRLARGLAFAAAAVLFAFVEIARFQSCDSFHFLRLLTIDKHIILTYTLFVKAIYPIADCVILKILFFSNEDF